MGGVADPGGLVGDGLDLGGQAGVGCPQMGVRVGQRGQQAAGVVVGECLPDQIGVVLGAVGQVRQGADLPGDLAQDRGVVAGLGGDRPVARSFVAVGLDALFTGPLAGTGRTQAQVAAFGGLTAGDPQCGGQGGPAHLLFPGGGDQCGFPVGQLLPESAQHGERGEEVGGRRRSRAGIGEHALDQRDCLGGCVSARIVVQCVVLSVTFDLSSFRRHAISEMRVGTRTRQGGKPC